MDSPFPARLVAGVRPRRAIERYFEVSLFLLVIIGFTTIAGTGKLDFLSVVLVGGALAYRAVLLVRGKTPQISDVWTTWLTLIYIVFYGADYLFLSRSFVLATVHLLLFSMVVKLFSVQRDRDHLYLAVLSFLEVLASAVLTVDSFFLGAFVVFMLIAVTTFISMEMKRSAAAAEWHAHDTGQPPRRMARALSWTAAVLVLLILQGAVGFFFLLPRFSANYMGAFANRDAVVTGFSDVVDLGRIGQIQQSSSVVMHVQVEGDTTGKTNLYLRGVALANFDGKRWLNPQTTARTRSTQSGSFDFKANGMADAPAQRGVVPVRYRVLMEPIGSNVFFVVPVPELIYGNFRQITIDPSSGAIYGGDAERPIASYQALSNAWVPPPDELRKTQGAPPPQVALEYLQLPKVDPRVRQLALDVTKDKTNDYDRAIALNQYLRSTYGYTLQLPAQLPSDPIANFLFERKRGHCEYFASSLAIMLRTLGIPSRVVNGFRGGTFNPMTESFIVRAANAHSWVEAYFPGQGWMSLDPTPPDAIVTSDDFSARLSLYLDAMGEFWREWVVNYDLYHQNSLSNNVMTGSRRMYFRWRFWMEQKYQTMLREARRASLQAQRQPKQWTFLLLGGVALFLLLTNVGKVRARWRERSLAAQPERAPSQAASVWYLRMVRALSRRGLAKPEAATPAEFAARIPQPQLRSAVTRFTRCYEGARFGGSVEDARALPELYEEVVAAEEKR